MENLEEKWLPWPKDNRYLVSNTGRVIGKSGKELTAKINKDRGGYYFYNIDKPNTKNQRTKIALHRILIETFNPIENDADYVVDHINGIKTDNRLENLRWVTAIENNMLSVKNREKINKHINKLIATYGYQKTTEMILSL